MKILQINTVYKNGGSTGRIVYDLKRLCEEHGIESYVAYGYEFSSLPIEDRVRTFRMESIAELQWAKIQTRFWPRHGFYNIAPTKRLLRWMEEIKPDIIHLHNLHNHYINVRMLFQYIKEHDIPVVWTLHDCWAFTGWCAYFDMAHCKKWVNGCNGTCPCRHDYPYTWFFDRSEHNWKEKSQTFCGVKRMSLVSPSEWLGGLIRQSFLKEYPVEIINNGVDTDLFRPKYVRDIYQKYGIPEGKHIILAVMNSWGKRKGSDYLLRLPSLLSNDECLVIVGLNSRQLNLLPKEHCVGVVHSNNIQELVALYSIADVFINPTLEDNFPTTNIEALACGTPIVTFRTGGSIECVNESTGLIVEQGDLEGLFSAICIMISRGKTPYVEACVKEARVKYNKNVQYAKYIELYRKV